MWIRIDRVKCDGVCCVKVMGDKIERAYFAGP